MSQIDEMFSLKGHLALVTGSSRGIGRSIARVLGLAGARVIYHASKPAPRLDEAVAEAKADGVDATCVACDISDDAALRAMLASLPELPDILVLNASCQHYMTLEDFDPKEFDLEFAANVRATITLCKACLPGMIERKWGRVIAIGSVNEWKQAPRLPIYAASKSAQSNFIMSLARFYARHGITSNTVAPGVITTDRNTETLSDPDTVQRILFGIPAKRIGAPDEIAGTVLLLASDAGSYINGANIPVTGGMHL